MSVILDLMEYASDGAARTAYPADVYDADFLSGGTPSADSESGLAASNACDNNIETYWYASVNRAHWWKYDLGPGIAKTIKKIRIKANNISAGQAGLQNFVLKGSNNGTDWTTIYSGTHGNNENWEDFVIPNVVAYRYYMLDGLNGYYPQPYHVLITEIEMLEWAIKVGSESTIKTEGSYALKAIASTGSLNGTLTRAVSPTINLSNETIIKFDVRASRTGSNFKIGIHDSGGTTTEITPNVLDINTWQLVVWDISAVANANKDAIDSIIITIMNADAENTLYFDNIYADVIKNYIIDRGRSRTRSIGVSLG